MKLIRAKLIFLSVAILVSFVGSYATAAPDDACLAKLARGDNRFGEPLPMPALKQIVNGMRDYNGYLGQKRYALLVDYTRNSRFKRAFMIDFAACDLKSQEYVIHGGSIYHPREQHFGEPQQDGMLRYCKRPDGTNKTMTRPGLFMTWGCHQTRQSNWTQIGNGCQGIKLVGLEQQNRDAYAKGVVLHEHVNIPNDSSVKLAGQGCPAFPPGRLQQMLRYGLNEKTMVLVYAPQCTRAAAASATSEAREVQAPTTQK